MMGSELNQQDYSDSRLDDMQDVLDCVDMKAGVTGFFNTVISPFADHPDWSMLAEWNANSIIGVFQRHHEQCIKSLDKTKDLMQTALREDVGNEITKLNVDKLIFRRDAQEINIKRAESILNEFHICYEVTFGKKFMPQSKAPVKDVTKQMKEYNMTRLKEALGK